MAKANEWTRDQLLMALRLYMRTSFGRLHGKNPEIIELAAKIGRTASALAMNASNFASINPKLNRKGKSPPVATGGLCALTVPRRRLYLKSTRQTATGTG